MASNQTLCVFTPFDNEPPSASYATLDLRNGHPILDFDAAADENSIFTGVMPNHYSNGGVSVILMWAAESATSGNVVWTSAFERIGDEDLDIDSDSFATANSGTFAAPATSGLVQYSTINHSNGAQMDSVVAGDLFRLRVVRDADNGSDTMTGDAELLGIHIKEQ